MNGTDSRVERFLASLNGKHITFCGIGRSNAPSAELFASHGAKITVCDRRSREEMGEMGDRMEKIGATFHLGADYLSNLDGDIIFRTPGMPFFTPELTDARRRGLSVTSEMEMFFELCPCPIYAITGSNGKTTTSTILAEFFRAQGKNVHLGGNIGVALLPEIETIQPDDVAVVELSSFQLISMRQGPQVAVITNITPDHLDMHKDMEEYVNAKKNIFLHQNAFSQTILNADNPLTASFVPEVRGFAQQFSRRHAVENGTWLRSDGMLIYSRNGCNTELFPASDILIPGGHNIENFLAAIAAAWGMVSIDTMHKVAKTFHGVEHRAEFVRELHGVRYYNDSIATTPSKAIYGMLSMFPQKLILLAGGYDKLIPFDPLGPIVVEKVCRLILFGATADKIEAAVRNAEGYREGCPEIYRVQNMGEAVQKAYELAQPGDIVALSPACASFDQFPSYTVRGREFKQMIANLR